VNENAGYPSWAHIITDIEDQGVPLTAVEIDAAIDYPLWHVPVFSEKQATNSRATRQVSN